MKLLRNILVVVAIVWAIFTFTDLGPSLKAKARSYVPPKSDVDKLLMIGHETLKAIIDAIPTGPELQKSLGWDTTKKGK